MTHGHQFDPFIGDEGRLPFFVTWMIGGLRRLGFSRLADFLEGPFYDWGQRFFKALEMAAIKALHHGKNNVIVMGHSHQMACLPIGRGVYVNSGACVPDSLRYVSIDTVQAGGGSTELLPLPTEPKSSCAGRRAPPLQ